MLFFVFPTTPAAASPWRTTLGLALSRTSRLWASAKRTRVERFARLPKALLEGDEVGFIAA
jgi:hypothetical protein